MGGKKLQVMKYPDTVLAQKAKPVAKVDAEIKKLARDMLATMRAEKGVGLAATQVGVAKRVIVLNPDPDKPGGDMVLINPVILERKGFVEAEEGCLSFPGAACGVKRYSEVKVKGMDLDEREVTIEAKGLPARIFQHEIDHLDGMLFVHRLGFLKRREMLKKNKEFAGKPEQAPRL